MAGALLSVGACFSLAYVAEVQHHNKADDKDLDVQDEFMVVDLLTSNSSSCEVQGRQDPQEGK